jgi:hypothetical protein
MIKEKDEKCYGIEKGGNSGGRRWPCEKGSEMCGGRKATRLAAAQQAASGSAILGLFHSPKNTARSDYADHNQ